MQIAALELIAQSGCQCFVLLLEQELLQVCLPLCEEGFVEAWTLRWRQHGPQSCVQGAKHGSQRCNLGGLCQGQGLLVKDLLLEFFNLLLRAHA